MVKSATNAHLHQEEEEDDDYEDLVARNDNSSYNRGETVKAEGKGGDQKTNTHRSKHSETEQRRRSKINERFQTLRDLIPQNDQKRDKASFLLEVIEYIQFLQEKLQTYEGSYQAWGQEPAKLIPWRNNHGHAESFIDHSQVIKNGSGCENGIVAPAVLTNAPSSIDSDLGTAAVLKAFEHPSGTATSMLPLNMHAQSNIFGSHGRGSIPAQPLHDSASDAENMSYQPQPLSWHGIDCQTESAVPNNAPSEQEDLTIKGESASLSSAYSQGILNTLTQALQSSGVDMSQASISVQIDVGKRTNSGVASAEGTSMASSSKDKETQFLSNTVMANTGVQSCGEDSDQAYKRRRTSKS